MAFSMSATPKHIENLSPEERSIYMSEIRKKRKDYSKGFNSERAKEAGKIGGSRSKRIWSAEQKERHSKLMKEYHAKNKD